MSTRLFVARPRATWQGSRALDYLKCPWCATELTRHIIWTQPPLFAHGGHGEATRVDTRHCECGATTVTSTEATNPRPFRP